MATATSKRFVAKNGIDNNSQTIINVADPVNAQDAVTKNYITNTVLTNETLATVTGRGSTTSSAVSITNTTSPTSSSTGALVVNGGIGVGSNGGIALYVPTSTAIARNGDIAGTGAGYLDVTNLSVRRGDGASTGASLTVYGSGIFSGAIRATNEIAVDSAPSTYAFALRTAGSTNRWRMWLAGTETGTGNTGSDFYLTSYIDAGSAQDHVIQITRASGGTVTINRPVSAGNITLSGNIVATDGTLSTSINNNRLWFNRAASNSYIDQSGIGGNIVFRTSATTSIDTTAITINSVGATTFANTVTATQLISNIAQGTAPLAVTSNTVVTNLNADLHDGYNATTANTASTIVARDGSGNIAASTGTFTGLTVSTTAPTISITDGGGASNEGILYYYSGATVKWQLSNNDAGSSTYDWSLKERTNNTYKIQVGQGTSGNILLNQSGGNVGIGTTAPGAKLHVVDGVGSLKFQDVSQANLTLAGTNASFIVNSTSGTAPVISIQTAGTTNMLMAADSTGWGVSTSWSTNQITLLKSGNFGIGTTSPSALLHVNGDTIVSGNLTVNGTTTTLNSNTITIDDKNIELGSVISSTISTTGTVGTITGTGPWTATITGMTTTSGLIVGSAIAATAGTGTLYGGSPTSCVVASIVSSTSITYTVTGGTTPTAGTVTTITTTGATNLTADGGGITVKGATDKTFNWVNSTSAWTSSEHLALASGKTLLLNGSTSGTITIQPIAAAGTNTITFPAATGTVALTSQLPTVNDGTLTLATSGTGLSGSASFTANQSGSTTFTVTSNATNANTASTIVARDSAGAFSMGALTASSIIKSGGTSSQFLKADGSVDSNTYITSLSSQSLDFGTVSIGADSGYTWGTANTNTSQVAEIAGDTLTLVRGLTGATPGIDLYTNTVAGTDAIKIAHTDTSNLSGAQGSAGIASFTVDEMGHVTAVTTATYAVDSGVVHLAGTETITGNKSITTTGYGAGTYQNGLSVTNTPGGAVARNDGGVFYAVVNDGAVPTDYMAGLEGRAISNHTTGTIPTAYGLKFSVENRATGTITSGTGIYSQVGMYGSNVGTYTNAYGVYVSVDKGSGTIGTSYGLYISASNGTTNYGVYAPAGADNYFAGTIHSAAITSTGSVTAASIIKIMSGTNDTYARLYADATQVQISADFTSTGSYVPIYFSTSGTVRLTLGVNGAASFNGNSVSMGALTAAAAESNFGTTGNGSDNGIHLIGGGTKNWDVKAKLDNSFGIAEAGVAYRFTIAPGGAATFASSVSMGALTATSGSYSSSLTLTRNSASGWDPNNIFFYRQDAAGAYLTGSQAIMQLLGKAKSTAGIDSNPATIQMYQDSSSATGVAGSLHFLTGDGTSTNATERLVITSTGQVGIGVTSPTSGYKLDIDGSAKLTYDVYTRSGSLFLGYIASGVYGLATYSTNNMAFSTNSTERMRIDSSGNVGIGTSPSYKLDVSGVIHNNGAAFLSHGIQGDSSGLTFSGAGSNYGRLYERANDSWSLGYTASYTGGSSPVITWNSSGNVGIGTTTPASVLEISRLEATNRTTLSNILTISALANNLPYTGHGGGLLFRGSNYTHNNSLVDYARISATINDDSVTSLGASLGFDVTPTSGTPVLTRAMTIRYDGNVGIGTTGPGHKLTLGTGNLAVEVGSIYISSGYTFQFNYGVDNNYYINKVGTALHHNTGGTFDFIGGNVGIGTTTPVAKLQVSAATTPAFPTNTGTTQPGIIQRLMNGSSDLVLDIGGYGGNGVWFQATNQNGLGNTYPILLNPVGGSVGIGTTAPNRSIVNIHAANKTLASTTSIFAITASDALAADIGGSMHFGAHYDATSDFAPLGYIAGRRENATSGSFAGYLQFAVTGGGAGTIEAMRINSSGNVGIGTTSPGYKLELSGSAQNWSTSPSIVFTDTAGVANSRRWMVGNVATNYGDLNFAVSTTASDAPTNPKMTISKDGNVGIGTTTPGYKLDVAGDINISTGSKFRINGVELTTGGSVTVTDDTSTNATYYPLVATTAGGSTLKTSSTKLTFNPYSGNLGIGTAPTSAKLAFPASTYASGGIDFGTDTNLYRLAANNLMTDDRFISSGFTSYDTVIVNSTTTLANGDNSGGYTIPQMILEWFGSGKGYRHYIHSRHSSGGAANNAIDFYTSDGTQLGAFPTNAVLGLTITNGAVGIGTLAPGSKLHVNRTLANDDWSAITIANSGSWSTASGKAALINVTDSDTVANSVGKFGIGFDGSGYFVVKGLYNGGYAASGEVFKVTPTTATFTGSITGVGSLSITGAWAGILLCGKSFAYSDGGTNYFYNPGSGWSFRNTADTLTVFGLSNAGAATVASNVTTGGTYKRSTAGVGHLDGNYSSVETSATPGCIYTIGGVNYQPTSTTLGNMYGIGYGYSGNAGITATNCPGSKWGMYVASNGTSRIFLDADAGNIYANGSGNFVGSLNVTSTSNDPNIRVYTSGAGAWVTADSASLGYAAFRIAQSNAIKWVIGNSNNSSDYCVSYSADGASNRFFSITTAGVATFTNSITTGGNLNMIAGDGYGLKLWSSDSYSVHMSSSGNATYGGRVTGETTSDYNMYFTMTGGTNRGFVWRTANSSSNVIAGLDATGTLRLTGNLIAVSKSFLINHPTQEGKKLQYGSLEGPENGVYVRGRLKNNDTIELPEYWTKLVDPDSITVSLTPIGPGQKLYIENIYNNKVTIASDTGIAINCFYVVYGERIDIDKLIVEF